MPSDRAFSLVERQFKKHETILLPEEYDNMIREIGYLHILGSPNVPCKDFKVTTNRLLKVKYSFFFFSNGLMIKLIT